ncbi:hypothetical protein [Chitinophaga nivalis]|uniref:Outer membrane protein beta-barrel domain-containing protein n=1 Tax=Chitinophaga nivalis TaxID=2991709 RepID=A0ABT3ISH2_9BACT|nr:hypothetical protein [Chitinophaga nivalis]MCW3463384.1 hypothetical protein [Chitinophaga nivalis]MCW3486926.1 hypothetical protein [Chitinophaga nivalis]
MPRLRTLLLCAVCCCLLPLFAAAQRTTLFSHEAGSRIYKGKNHLSGGLVYSPRYNFVVFSTRSTLSVGANIGLGSSFGANYDSNIGGNYTSIFMADVPFLVAYNFGNGATYKAYTKWGGYIGGGYGFHNGTRSVEYYDDEELTTNQVHVSGVVVSLGLRLPIANTSWTIHVSYMHNSNGFNPDIPGIGSAGIAFNINTPIRRPE